MPYTGHLPSGIAGESAVLVEISIGVATPAGCVVGEILQATPVGSLKFWLMTYSRWPCRVGLPTTAIGVGATGIASLNAWGELANRSTTLPFKSAAQRPADGAKKLTGLAVEKS